MTQRSVEIVIGRLVSDEDLRALFRNNRAAAIAKLRSEGIELNDVETEALAALDPAELGRLSRALDQRLQRASLDPKRRRKLTFSAIYILIQLAAASAGADPWDYAKGSALAFAADRGQAVDARARAAADPSGTSTPMLSWHRQTQDRVQPLGLLTFRGLGRQRGRQ